MANLTTSVRRSVKAMYWLEESDSAAVELAIRQAKALDDIQRLGDEELTAKAVGKIGPHLLTTLKSLGGTPAERKALGGERQTKSRLAEIRALRSS
ncbi:MAG: hypothetical protein IPN92_21075 [Chromatiaceae bacterium]|nr:hypothetical protein [Chromatiaceae bacterium]